MITPSNRKRSLLHSGTLSPNPGDLTLSRQNVCYKLKAPERRTGVRGGATRAPIQGPEWQGAVTVTAPKLQLKLNNQETNLHKTIDTTTGRGALTPL
jgi:hypothetical protein